MAYFVDRSGQLVEHEPRDVGEYDALIARGYAPATDADIERHNHALDVAEQGGGALDAVATGAKQRLGSMVSLGEQAVQNVAPGFGTAPGLEPSEEGVAPTVGGAGLFPDAFSERAKLQQEANPIAFGVGQGLASAPLAGGLGAAAPGIAAIPFVGGTVGAVATEAAVEGALQEYDDAWLQERPYELQNVVANTLMFGAFDLGMRGLLKGAGKAFGEFSGKPAELSIGRSNVVSEAEGEAARVTGGKRALRSVGAASSGDIQEPFDDAIKGMSDRDAAVLARDGDDHIHLVAQSAADDMTRINRGLDEDLGSHLKYEDFAKNAQGWTAKTMERQASAIEGLLEQTDEAAQAIGRFAGGDQQAVDFGNIGKRIVQDINGFNTRIASEVDPARRNVLIDEFKKTLDLRMMGIDASISVDRITREELKGILRPIAGKEGSMRRMLENDLIFPGNAEMQKDMNGGWHQLLEHWSAVSRELLEKTGHVQFDKSGAGRITMESTVDRWRNLLSQDPRSIQEFGRHLKGAFDGLGELIGARERHGITATEGLPEMRQALGNLMEDWNLASTIGVAKNRANNLAKDPRKWATVVGNLAERIPFGVGKAVEAARTLGNAMPDLHIEKGTALADVWDAGYKRYALHEALQDPSISRNYADWMLEALKERGGRIAAAGGLFGASALQDDEQTGMAGAGAGALALLFPKGLAKTASKELKAVGRVIATLPEKSLLEDGAKEYVERLIKRTSPKISDAETKLVMSKLEALQAMQQQARAAAQPKASEVDYLAEQIGEQGGQTPGGMFRGSDGKERYVKFLQGAKARDEVANGYMYRDFGVDAVQQEHVSIPTGKKEAVISERLGPEWQTIEKAPSAKLNPEVVRAYVRGIPADLITGNWDVASNGANLMTDGKRVLRIDVGEAGPGSGLLSAHVGDEWEMLEEHVRHGGYRIAEQERKAPSRTHFVHEQRMSRLKPAEEPGKPQFPMAMVAKIEGGMPAIKDELAKGLNKIELAIAKAGGESGYVEMRFPHLDDFKKETLAKALKRRVDFVRENIDKIAAIVVAGGWALAPSQAQAAERDPGPSAPPVSPYRDALKNVDVAGRVELERLASQLVRPRANRARLPADTLRAFTGSADPREAVEAAREALDRIAADPRALIEQVSRATGDLSKTHPSVFQGIVGKAAQITTYLQSVAPQRVGATAGDPRGSPMSLDEAYDFAARYAGAAWPRLSLKDVARETAAPEQVEALKANWPDRWEQFRMTSVGMVTRMAAAGRPLDSERLRRLDDMLELNGMLDSTASPEVTQAMLAAQDAAGAKQGGQVPSGRSGSPSVAGSLSTRLQAINSERNL